MGKQSFARGAVWRGRLAHFSGPEVDHMNGPYALDDDQKLLLRAGKPVRLMHIDLAPEDPDDGKECYVIAGPADPPQTNVNVVELEPEQIKAVTKAGA